MSKYDCTKTIDYAHEFTRMCDDGSGACPLHKTGCGLSKLTEETIATVQKWSDEHPEKPKLTKKERAFLDSFEILANKSVQNLGGKRFLVLDGTDFKIMPLAEDMFRFVATSMSLSELADLEVEDDE